MRLPLDCVRFQDLAHIEAHAPVRGILVPCSILSCAPALLTVV